jgi:hypothetical protein
MSTAHEQEQTDMSDTNDPKPNPFTDPSLWSPAPGGWEQWRGEIRDFVRGKFDERAKALTDRIVSALALPGAIAKATGTSVHEHQRDGREVADVLVHFGSRAEAHAFWRAIQPFITPKGNVSVTELFPPIG